MSTERPHAVGQDQPPPWTDPSIGQPCSLKPAAWTFAGSSTSAAIALAARGLQSPPPMLVAVVLLLTAAAFLMAGALVWDQLADSRARRRWIERREDDRHLREEVALRAWSTGQP